MAVLVAEIEVEACPLMVVRALGWGHPSPFEQALKGCPGFSGNLLHGNRYCFWAEAGEGGIALWTPAS